MGHLRVTCNRCHDQLRLRPGPAMGRSAGQGVHLRVHRVRPAGLGDPSQARGSAGGAALGPPVTLSYGQAADLGWLSLGGRSLDGRGRWSATESEPFRRGAAGRCVTAGRCAPGGCARRARRRRGILRSRRRSGRGRRLAGQFPVILQAQRRHLAQLHHHPWQDVEATISAATQAIYQALRGGTWIPGQRQRLRQLAPGTWEQALAGVLSGPPTATVRMRRAASTAPSACPRRGPCSPWRASQRMSPTGTLMRSSGHTARAGSPPGWRRPRSTASFTPARCVCCTRHGTGSRYPPWPAGCLAWGSRPPSRRTWPRAGLTVPSGRWSLPGRRSVSWARMSS